MHPLANEARSSGIEVAIFQKMSAWYNRIRTGIFGEPRQPWKPLKYF